MNGLSSDLVAVSVMAMDYLTPYSKDGDMKSHIALLREILEESGIWCGTSTTRDMKYITGRVSNEGLSFLTITLPSFADDLLEAIDKGGTDSTMFLSFRNKACLPSLFSGFTSQIFDISTGRLLDVPSIDAIRCLLQVCNLLRKLNVPCSDARVNAALDQYVEIDKQVWEADLSLPREDRESFMRMSALLYGKLFRDIDESIYNGELLPKHGPGATAQRISGNQKYRSKTWHQRLEYIFPHGEYLFPNYRHYDGDAVTLLSPGAEDPSRVITVPKTQKTPRIIAIEPVCMQYTQQAVLRKFVSGIERDEILSNFIGFTDQKPNQRLARKGSLTGTLATLDLSEASDRVSFQLVQNMFWLWPLLGEAVTASRSKRAEVPGRGIIPLAKFASMGSALCFPIEMLVFTAIIFLGIEKANGRPLSKRDIKSLIGKVRIYGDDIIVPVEYVHPVIAELEAFGLKVNARKSFWTGEFRESCGKEYFKGVDVSIVKVRENFPTNRQHASEIISLVSLRNQLFIAGYSRTCEWLDNKISRIIPFPLVLPTSPVLGRWEFNTFSVEKTCPHLQRPLVRGVKVSSVSPRDFLDGPDALLKCFLSFGEEADEDGSNPVENYLVSNQVIAKDHLERAGRPRAVNIKLGWFPAY